MIFEWCENKRTCNFEKHTLDFACAHELWLSDMYVTEDTRFAYGEQRFIALGLLKSRIVVCIYTKRENEVIRIISLRKANHREIKSYEQYIKTKT